MTKSKKPTPKKVAPSSKSESTSKKVAKIAGRAIKHPAEATDDEVQTLAASALTQVDDEETTDAKALDAEVVAVDIEESASPAPDAPAEGDTIPASTPLVTPLEAAIAVEALATDEASRFQREMAEQVQAPVTYHFPTEAEAEQHAQVARETVAPNGRLYRVQRDGVHVKVSLG